MKEKIHISFYDENDREISRRTYRNGYGGALTAARKRAKKIGAKYYWHIEYLRRFQIND